MQAFLAKIWRLRPGELSIVLVLGVAILGNSLAQKVAEIAALSNFLNDVGAPQFLIVLTLSSLVSLITTSGQAFLVDRFDRKLLIKGACIGLGGAFILLRLLFMLGMPSWLNYSLFYLLSDLQFTFFPLSFWILANDVFDVAQTKRLFPLLASWGLTGNLLGIGITAISPRLFSIFNIPAQEILLLNISVYLLIFVILQVGLKTVKLRKVQHKYETVRETLTEGWEFIQDVPAFRYLTISILAVIFCENIIDFRFFVVSESGFDDAGTYQMFFSLFALIRVVTYLLVQSLFTERVISALNLKNAFLIQPISSFLAVVCAIAIPGISGSIIGVAMQKVPQYTIDETIRKSFQGLVPPERRGRVSLFMDSYLIAFGAICAAIMTGVIIIIGESTQFQSYAYIYMALAAIASVVAVGAIFKMRSVYDQSLLNWRLKRRQRGKSVLDKLDF